jgi:hypothetical protein
MLYNDTHKEYVFYYIFLQIFEWVTKLLKYIYTFTMPIAGTYKLRNEIETKRNETIRNQRKRNETKRNETK